MLVGWLAVVAVSARRIAATTGPLPGPAGPVVPLTALATLGLAGLGLLLVTTAR